MLTQAILKEKLHYSIITGEFYWLKPKQGVKTDNVAGALNLSGHRKIMVNGKLYYAHRLAWFYCTGEFPKHEIDHKNGITDANQWLNLREATRSQNQHNTSLRSDNTSGYKGVTWKLWRTEKIIILAVLMIWGEPALNARKQKKNCTENLLELSRKQKSPKALTKGDIAIGGRQSRVTLAGCEPASYFRLTNK